MKAISLEGKAFQEIKEEDEKYVIAIIKQKKRHIRDLEKTLELAHNDYYEFLNKNIADIITDDEI